MTPARRALAGLTAAAAPRQQVHVRRSQPSESRELQAWTAEHHYLRSTPPAHRFALEVLAGGRRIGSMLWGLPPRELDQVQWLALTRMFFVDETDPCVESQALAVARRHVRTWEPSVRCLLAYSDPSVGHEGTVYAADGWARFGRTRGSRTGYGNRPGRCADTQAPKMRWVRTP